MSAIRKEVQSYIDTMPDNLLEALRPILTVLANDTVALETDLTDEERKIICAGRESYKAGNYVSLGSLGI